MLHPDILLMVIRQRQRELWDEAAHAAQVRQLKATAGRLPTRDSLGTGAYVPVAAAADNPLHAASTVSARHERAA